jgi:hypothetical protein
MKKIKLDTPAIILPLAEHAEIKEELLKLIDAEEAGIPIIQNDTLDITRCDYGASFKPRVWSDFIKPYILAHKTKVSKDLGYDGFSIHNIWFQQYKEGSTHGWHIHTKCQWTNVYYVDMPEGAPKTQLVNPWNQTDIITMDVKEGDVLTFPSFVIHRAPANAVIHPKTIVSFNSDVELDFGS